MPARGVPKVARARADRRPVTGRRGEYLAADHLRHRGYLVIARNQRTPAGEIDLVALRGEMLVFVEVKTARVTSDAPELPGRPHRAPLESLRARQRRRIRRAAAAWLRGEVSDPTGDRSAVTRTGRPSAAAIRFDAIGVTLDARGDLHRLDHIEGAW